MRLTTRTIRSSLRLSYIQARERLRAGRCIDYLAQWERDVPRQLSTGTIPYEVALVVDKRRHGARVAHMRAALADMDQARGERSLAAFRFQQGTGESAYSSMQRKLPGCSATAFKSQSLTLRSAPFFQIISGAARTL